MSSKKLDAAIDALVDALAELPEHELEGWQRGNRLGLRILCELGRRYPGLVQATGPVRRKSAWGEPVGDFRGGKEKDRGLTRGSFWKAGTSPGG